MTFRAILIGLLLGLGIVVFGYFNDWVVQSAMVASDLVPISVYGLLVLGLLLVNPLLKRLGGRHLKGAEWCVIVSLMLVACVVPGAGLMWNFSNSLVMPHHYQVTLPNWKSNRLIDYAPPVMLVEPGTHPGQQYDAVVGGFRTGLEPGKIVPFGKVPWQGWTKTLSFWLPLLGLSFIAGICLVLILHAQWVHRERLRYPVADFASQLISGSGRTGLAGIFHKKQFWIGFVPIVLILLINGYWVWNKQSINIPLTLPLAPLAEKWTILKQLPDWWLLKDPRIVPAAVGFAYFVSTDVSGSMSLGYLIFPAIFLFLSRTHGLEMQTSYLEGGLHSFQLFGSYLGTGLIIFYVGRRFYLSVLAKALMVPTGDRVERNVIWACRGALVAAVAIVLLLVVVVKLHWLLAIMFVMLTGLMFLIITRISAETGLFFVQSHWHPVAIMLGLFGINALGPNMLIILALLCIVMTIDPRVCMMPMAANAMRLSETGGVRPGRIGRWMMPTALAALVLGVIVTVYVQYNYGGGTLYPWANVAARMPFEMLERNLPALQADPNSAGMAQLGNISPNGQFLAAVGIGLILVLACSAARLRFHWWPIHPVLFLVWGTFPLKNFGPSFMLGWLIKVAVTHLGGGASYRRNKPIFVGIIAGEFVGLIIWAVVGLIYYLITGVPGERFSVHP